MITLNLQHYQRFSWFAAGWLLAVPMAFAMQREALQIHTQRGEIRMQVDVARQPDELKAGLMKRDSLPADYGMLFDFGKPDKVRMWMKDTPLPLDMLFIDAQGVVIHLEQSATPNSTRRLGTADPIRAVLELPGGTIQRKGIKLYDTVSHAIFRP